ncbi:MAG: rhomboid family intramembrane serine protease [Eubacteriales bacterium]|nr:rhomboid family intramembrane serine protease [Eubacteriales bacterium]
MLKCLLVQIRKNRPIITLTLIFSCLLSTIPQFFLPDVYNSLSGQYPDLSRFYFLALPAFTHSPGMLARHLIGNLLVFLLFGSLIECLIGSKRLALISLVTFASTTCIDYLHTNWPNPLGGEFHGASGICWGYHVFFIFVLILLYEKMGRKVFKDAFVIGLIVLCAFDFVGIPVFEVVFAKQGFFSNFGQTLHLVSMIVVIPFLLAWRKEIECNVQKLITMEPIEFKNRKEKLSLILFGLLVCMNAYGTIRLIAISCK